MTGGRSDGFSLEWPERGPEDRALDPDAAEATLRWDPGSRPAVTPAATTATIDAPVQGGGEPQKRRLRVRVRDDAVVGHDAEDDRLGIEELRTLVAELRAEIAVLRAQVRESGGSA